MQSVSVSQSEASSAYKAMLFQKTSKDIAFSGQGLNTGQGLSLLNKEELTALSAVLSEYTYLKGNCRKVTVVGHGVPKRQFHMISLNNVDVELDRMSFMAFHLFNIMIDGIVIAFDTKKQRDKFASTLKME